MSVLLDYYQLAGS